MAKTKQRVLFRFGSRAEYDALAQKDSNCLYFLLDTNELYRGEVPIGVSHYYGGVIQTNETFNTAVQRILDQKTPVPNDLLTLVAADGIEDLYIYLSDGTWKQLNATVRGESVLFGDGDTLEEKLQSISQFLSIDENVLEIDDDVLTIRDYGKEYYEYIPEVPAQGVEGQPGYVPAVPAHYELVTVDENHPWPEGLSPRTNSEGSISWYAPNLSTLDGINDTITSLQELIQQVIEVNDQQTQTLESLQQDLLTLHDLQVVVGEMGDPEEGTESTGLIKRIEDLENLTGANLTIKINGNALVPVDGVVDIPLFGADHDGVVPRFDSAVQSIEEENLKHVHLSPVGWNDSIGDLTFNHIQYNTVTEYVDARIEDSTLQWETIND